MCRNCFFWAVPPLLPYGLWGKGTFRIQAELGMQLFIYLFDSYATIVDDTAGCVKHFFYMFFFSQTETR